MRRVLSTPLFIFFLAMNLDATPVLSIGRIIDDRVTNLVDVRPNDSDCGRMDNAVSR